MPWRRWSLDGTLRDFSLIWQHAILKLARNEALLENRQHTMFLGLIRPYANYFDLAELYGYIWQVENAIGEGIMQADAGLRLRTWRPPQARGSSSNAQWKASHNPPAG
jgi:hypothetical protein